MNIDKFIKDLRYVLKYNLSNYRKGSLGVKKFTGTKLRVVINHEEFLIYLWSRVILKSPNHTASIMKNLLILLKKLIICK